MTSPLDNVQVASPCRQPWEFMKGDARTRFCELCRQKVYNLSDMTRAEAEAFVQANLGACVKFFRREDGTMLTRDCKVTAPADYKPGPPPRSVSIVYRPGATGREFPGRIVSRDPEVNRRSRELESKPMPPIRDYGFPELMGRLDIVPPDSKPRPVQEKRPSRFGPDADPAAKKKDREARRKRSEERDRFVEDNFE